MIRARHNFFVYNFFKIYNKINIRRNFNEVKVIGDVDVANHSVLIIANHVSWWDGFWVLHLCMNVLYKKFHFMMLENELKKRPLFSLSGGFSIAKGAKSIVESLNYSSELLKDKGNLVLMFPQGKLHSIYNNEFKFEKGVERIIEKSPQSKLIFMATFIEYFDHPKPDLYIYLVEQNADTLLKNDLATAYSGFFNQCLDTHKSLEL